MNQNFVPLLACISMVLPTQAGTVSFGAISGGNYEITVPSITELRFKTVYKQQYDFSCGSAALASLLSFHYDDVVDEYTVFKDMFDNGNQEQIQEQGFSLLDMKRYLARRGYKSNGFKINLKQLAAAEVPAITIINNNGYMHFVIIKGNNEKEVLVGDPALGVKAINASKFEKMWNDHIIFVIQEKKTLASKHYRSQSEWKLRVEAKLGLAIDHSSLGLFNILQPSAIDF